MFNSYVDFVLYNVVGFLFALLVWNWLPKPKPYDYTTIPGHKLNVDSDELPNISPQPGTSVTTLSSTEGNLDVIQKHQSFRAFHLNLHLTFGPLASFYWGPRYVISVGSIEILKQLQSYEDSLLAIPALAISNILLGDSACWTHRHWKSVQSRATIANPHFINENDHTTENASRRLLTVYGVDEDKVAVTTVETLVEQLSEQTQERALIDGPFGMKNEEKIGSILDSLIRLIPSVDGCEIMCDLTSAIIAQEAQRPNKSDQSNTSFSRFLNALQRPLVIAFDKEIDIDGHPVPANIPILLCMEDLIGDFLHTTNQCAESEMRKLIEECFSWIPGLHCLVK
uniref:Cytochrome P450 n=1 Tax=Plectus sambesii TaxID=2011161 RepID=A0A914WGH3_9BILA